MTVRYGPRPTPTQPEEVPEYLASEIRKIANVLADLQDQINALEARVAALETP